MINRGILFRQIDQLEDELKDGFILCKSQRLQTLYKDLKILDAQKMSQEILYAKWKVFDYRDKPGKQLAQVLSGPLTKARVGHLKVEDGSCTDDIEEKLGILAKYYYSLYAQTDGHECRSPR